jgi:plastocyanin
MYHYARAQRWFVALCVALAAIVAPLMAVPARAESGLRIDVGAESSDSAVQVVFYFQGDVTVRQGTTVTWIFRTNEPHSIVSDSDQNPSGGPIDTGLETKTGKPLVLTFKQLGDFKYHCEIHGAMKGIVHVVPRGGAALPSQEYYDRISALQKVQLLAEGYRLMAQHQNPGPREVLAGIGIMHPMGEVYLLRYLKGMTTVRVGDTVTFTNRDPDAPHTITVNESYANFLEAQTPDNLTTALTTLPGAATLPNASNKLNSGWLMAAPTPFSRGTVFKLTFTKPGLYKYYCELHDDLGMVGQIRVVARDDAVN